jgi:PAS domain S-box-containing protein
MSARRAPVDRDGTGPTRYGLLVDDQPSTLVVVDDAAEVRLLVKHQLGRSGKFVVVGEGGTGHDAVDLADRHHPAVMLLDVSMPELDGLTALPLVRERSPETVVVMYTGFDEGGLAVRARSLGAAALIEKSTDIDRLAEQLDAIRRTAGEHAGRGAGEAAPEDVPPPGDVLDEHLERFREIFEEAAIGMATMTLTGNIVRPNRALAELVDRPIAELIGVPYASLAGPEDAGTVAERLHAAQAGVEALVRFEHVLPSEGGGRRWLLATVTSVRDARKRPLYLFMQVQDVTAQRRAEEEWRQSEERFRLLVEAVQDYAIFMLDPGGHVVSWNAGAQRIKQYRADEIIGKHFRTFYPPEMQAIKHPEHELTLAIRDGHYEEEGWRVRKDGSRFWASVVITAVYNRNGEHIGFAKVTRDVDERRQMTLELEEAASALATANASLESANSQLAQEAADQAQFLAVTAHELRSPVSVLSGSANLLADHWSDMTDEERGDLFQSVRLGAARLQRLLNDLLTASRLESKRLRPTLQTVDLEAVLGASAAAARASTPEAEFVIDSPPGVRVLGEPDRLPQVFDNLFGNAIRHGRAPVTVQVLPDGDRVEIRVSDAGPGVDPNVQDRLFQRFATGGRRGGTGLGLFIVRELARAYGGEAWYDGGGGTNGRFVVSLIAADPAVPPSPDGPTG